MEPDEVRAIRKRWQMTQKELADYMGITRTAVMRWELDRSNPNARRPKGPARKLLELLATLPVPESKKR